MNSYGTALCVRCARRYTRKKEADDTPVHLDAAITVLTAVGGRSLPRRHMPVPVSLRDTGATTSVEGELTGVWELDELTHSQLTDGSAIDLYQGRNPAAKP